MDERKDIDTPEGETVADRRRTAADDRDRSGESNATAAAGRRPFLKALPVAPTIAALAGCDSLPGDGEDGTSRPGGPADGEPTGTPEPTDVEDIEPGDTVPFEEAIRFGRSFSLTGELRPTGEGATGGEGVEESTTTLSGRASDFDYRLSIESDESLTELYVVDGDRYQVIGDECLKYPDVGLEPSDVDSDAVSDVEPGEASDLTFLGTETIDDRELLAYELRAEVDVEGAAEDREAVVPRFYVGPETGFLYLLRAGGAEVRFEDWEASVPAVEAPAGDCTTVDVPDPKFYERDVRGEVVENAVDGLEVLDHEAGVGSFDTEGVDAPGFHVRLTVRNAGGTETDLLAYGYEVVAFGADGDRLSVDETTVWSFGASVDENRVPPGTADVVVVSPDGLATPSDIARYEVRVTCEGAGTYCGADQPTEPPDGSTAVGWPTFQRDTARTGATSADAGPTEPPDAAWELELSNRVGGSPTVGAETAYVGDGDGTIHAVALEDGAERWTTTLDAGVRSAPSLTEERAVVATLDGKMVALDRASGERLLTFETGDSFDQSPITTPTPAVVDDLAYFVDPDGFLFVVDLANRQTVWSFDTETEVHASPAVAAGTAYLATTEGDVYALDAGDGTFQWWKSFDAAVQSSPAVANGDVYLCTVDGRVVAIDAASGEVRWRFDPDESYFLVSSPAVTADRLYVASATGGSGSNLGSVAAIGTAEGQRQWAAGTVGGAFASPAVAGDTVYVSDAEGVTYAVDGASGDTVWQYTNGGGSAVSPALAGGRAYVVTVTSAGPKLVAVE